LASSESRIRSRRFLPPTPGVEAPYRLQPQLVLRLGLLGMLALAVFAILLLRLWALQVLSGDDYLRAARDNQLRTIRLEAPRGSVVDRKGRPLVINEPGTVVRVWPADLPRKGAYQELGRLARVLDVPLSRITADVERRRGDPVTPVIVKSDVTEPEARYLLERRREFPGVDVHNTFIRKYPHGMLAAHLLGQVGEISEEQLERRRRGGFRPGDRIGQAGLEAAYDAYLRGQPGLAQLRVDSLGKPRSAILDRKLPIPGNSLRTTIDIDVQRAAEQALVEWIENARTNDDCFGCWAANGGAIVALDPRDGAVRALASNPRYHPGVYSGRVDPKELRAFGLTRQTAKAKNFPAVNRATQGTYPAGSTWKPVTGLAAMQENLIGPYDELPCTPSYVAYKQKFSNWTSAYNQPMALATALETSCDTYFYALGAMFYELPEERRQPLQEWARRFGFGRRTGIEVGGESPGLLPTIAWRKRTFETELDRAWKPGDSIQLGIGQKDLQVTPLQMARFYAMVANGGRLVTPYVGDAVVQPGDERTTPAVLRTLVSRRPTPTGVDAAALEAVQSGLLRATHGDSGTSTAVFENFPITIAGKTGTAEKAVKLPGFQSALLVDQSWFCGYGPYSAPELVVCAVIENGGFGAAAAAPAALRVFERYFGRKAAFVQPQEAD
jgi:penicillin-binding protein 2